jgi:hypothetical protein
VRPGADRTASITIVPTLSDASRSTPPPPQNQ